MQPSILPIRRSLAGWMRFPQATDDVSDSNHSGTAKRGNAVHPKVMTMDFHQLKTAGAGGASCICRCQVAPHHITSTSSAVSNAADKDRNISQPYYGAAAPRRQNAGAQCLGASVHMAEPVDRAIEAVGGSADCTVATHPRGGFGIPVGISTLQR